MPLPLPYPGAFSRGAGGGFLPARDGTLAYNLQFLNEFSQAQPFLNMLKLNSEWTGDVTGDLLVSELDSIGRPLSIPAGNTYVQQGQTWNTDFFDNLKNRNIVYQKTGDATVEITGSVSIVSSTANRIVFRVTGNSWQHRITNNGTTGIGDAYAVFEEYEADYLAGEVFNPEWLRLFRRNYALAEPFQVHTVRFMDWMATNASPVVEFSDHISYDNTRWFGTSNRPNYDGTGAPIRMMCELCNKIGANPWFCFPHKATTDYAEALAAEINTYLSPNLTAYIEYGNETWNAGSASFTPASNWVIGLGVFYFGTQGTGTITRSGTTVTGTGTSFDTEVTAGDLLYSPQTGLVGTVSTVNSPTSITLTGGGDAVTDSTFWFDQGFKNNSAYSRRAYDLFEAFDAVHQRPTKRVRVCGTQYSQPSVTTGRLNAADWLADDPGTYVDPRTFFDAIATGAYFANSAITVDTYAAIEAAWDTDPDDGAQALHDAILADTGPTAISEVFTTMREQWEAADGIPVLQYEAGQHLTAIPASDEAKIKAVVRYYFTTALSATVLDTWGTAARAYTDGPINWFNLDNYESGLWAAFPSNDFAGDEKTDFLNDMANSPRWFGPNAPPVFIDTLPEITGQETLAISGSVRNALGANYGVATISGITGVSLTANADLTGAPFINGAGTYTVTLTNDYGTAQATGSYDIAVAPTLPVPEMVTFSSTYLTRSTALVGSVNPTRISNFVRYQRTATTNGQIIGQSGSTGPFDLQAQNNTAPLRLRLYNTSGTNFHTESFGAGLNDGNPHNLYWSYDGTTGALKIVVDSTTIVNSTITATALRGASWTPTIGANSAAGGTIYSGDLERVTVWNDVALDVTDSAVRTSIETLNLAGSLGNNIIDFYGPPATWNALTNTGTGGDFSVITGAVT